MSFAGLLPGQHSERVRDHWWWRPGWRVGRRFYAFHVTFADAEGLAGVAARYRAALVGMPGLTLIPNEWLHLTIQGIGFTDEIHDEDIRQVVATARQALREVDPLEVSFSQAVVSDEAIVLPVEPEKEIKQLRNAARAAIASALGVDRLLESADKFRPHVSVAYFTDSGAAAPYIAAVKSVHRESAGTRVDSLDLNKMHRDQRMYEWEPIARLRLG